MTKHVVFPLMYQGNLFDKSIFAERTLKTGTVIRLKLEPVGQQSVRVLEYYRKLPAAEHFKRLKHEEGKIVPFSTLNLTQSYEHLFG